MIHIAQPWNTSAERREHLGHDYEGKLGQVAQGNAVPKLALVVMTESVILDHSMMIRHVDGRGEMQTVRVSYLLSASTGTRSRTTRC